MCLGIEGPVTSPFRLNLKTMTWTTLQVKDFPRHRAAGVVFRERVYLIGGEPSTQQYLDVFDLKTESWVD